MTQIRPRIEEAAFMTDEELQLLTKIMIVWSSIAQRFDMRVMVFRASVNLERAHLVRIAFSALNASYLLSKIWFTTVKFYGKYLEREKYPQTVVLADRTRNVTVR